MTAHYECRSYSFVTRGHMNVSDLPSYLPPKRSVGSILDHSIPSNFRVVECLDIKPEL